MPEDKQKNKNSSMALAFQSIKPHLLQAGLFSAAVNFLMLVPIIYMLQVYDRVMSSGNQTTLLMLTLLMVALLVAMGCFNWVRTRMLIVASNKMEKNLRRVKGIVYIGNYCIYRQINIDRNLCCSYWFNGRHYINWRYADW